MMQPLDFKPKNKELLLEGLPKEPEKMNKEDLEVFNKAMKSTKSKALNVPQNTDKRAEEVGGGNALTKARGKENVKSDKIQENVRGKDKKESDRDNYQNIGDGDGKADTPQSTDEASDSKAEGGNRAPEQDSSTPQSPTSTPSALPSTDDGRAIFNSNSTLRSPSVPVHVSVNPLEKKTKRKIGLEGLVSPTQGPIRPGFNANSAAVNASEKAESSDQPQAESMEKVYQLIDRLLVNDPQFQNHLDDHQIILQLKGEFFKDTRLRLRRTQAGLQVALETSTPEAAARFTAQNLQGLQQRLETSGRFTQKVSVTLRTKEEEEQT